MRPGVSCGGGFDDTTAALHKQFRFLGVSGTYFFLWSVGEKVPSWEQWHSSRERKPSSATVNYRLVEPEPAEGSGDPAEPDDYASTSAAFRGRRFRRYAAQIDDFPDGHFDVVLIDGRARPSCIKHAAPKVAAEGLLIVDNTDRAYYVERTSSYLAPFEPRRFEGFGPVNAYRWETTIFIRPAAGEAAPR